MDIRINLGGNSFSLKGQDPNLHGWDRAKDTFITSFCFCLMFVITITYIVSVFFLIQRVDSQIPLIENLLISNIVRGVVTISVISAVFYITGKTLKKLNNWIEGGENES